MLLGLLLGSLTLYLCFSLLVMDTAVKVSLHCRYFPVMGLCHGRTLPAHQFLVPGLNLSAPVSTMHTLQGFPTRPGPSLTPMPNSCWGNLVIPLGFQLPQHHTSELTALPVTCYSFILPPCRAWWVWQPAPELWWERHLHQHCEGTQLHLQTRIRGERDHLQRWGCTWGTWQSSSSSHGFWQSPMFW